jgi:excisionase family DNA binding protein
MASTNGQASLPFGSETDRLRQAKATLTIPEAAKLLGVGRNLAYQSAAEDGELAGVPVIRVGRRMVVPRASLLAALGLTDTLPPPDADR